MKLNAITTDTIITNNRLMEKLDSQRWGSIFPQLGNVFIPKGLMLLSGATAAGKSRVCIGEILNALKLGKTVLYLHTEMLQYQITNILYHAGWKPKYDNRLCEGSVESFDDIRSIPVDDYRKFDLVVLDYLDATLFSTKDNMYSILAKVVHTFDHIRKLDNINTCFLLVSQLNGRITDKVGISDLDTANSHGLERYVDFHYAFGKDNTDDGVLNVEVRKDRYCIARDTKFSTKFDYKNLYPSRF